MFEGIHVEEESMVFLNIMLIQKKEPLMKDQNNKIANVAGSVCLGLVMDGSGRWELPSIHSVHVLQISILHYF